MSRFTLISILLLDMRRKINWSKVYIPQFGHPTAFTAMSPNISVKNSSSDSVKYLIIHRTDFFGQKDSYYSKGGIICYNSSYIIFCSIKVSGN